MRQCAKPSEAKTLAQPALRQGGEHGLIFCTSFESNFKQHILVTSFVCSFQMGNRARKRLSGGRKRIIKLKWKARTTIEREDKRQIVVKEGEKKKQATEEEIKNEKEEINRKVKEVERKIEERRSEGGRGEREDGSLLWPGCLFDTHCHLRLVLRYSKSN